MRSTGAASPTSTAAKGRYPVQGHLRAGVPPWSRRQPGHGPSRQQGVRGRRSRAAPRGGGGGGSGQGKAGQGGKGEDDFVFELSREEFLDLLFDDLELPNLVRNQLIGTTEFKTVRAGYTTEGAPQQHRRGALAEGRHRPAHRAWRAASRRIRELEAEIDALLAAGVAETDERCRAARGDRPAQDAHRRAAVHRHLRPALSVLHQAAGADQQGRDALHHGRLGLDGSGAQEPGQALLHPAVSVPAAQLRQDRGRLHPPPHHRQEVDEQEFFYSRETGGTVVSSALNWPTTSSPSATTPAPGTSTPRRRPTATTGTRLRHLPRAADQQADAADALLRLRRDHPAPAPEPLVRLPGREGAHPHFAMEEIGGADDIYPVFRELFKRQA
jgi:hypothetical protein